VLTFSPRRIKLVSKGVSSVDEPFVDRRYTFVAVAFAEPSTPPAPNKFSVTVLVSEVDSGVMP
jgi:hypothetical protein